MNVAIRYRSDIEKVNKNQCIACNGCLTDLLAETKPSYYRVLELLVEAKTILYEDCKHDDMYYEEDVDTITLLDSLIVDAATEFCKLMTAVGCNTEL